MLGWERVVLGTKHSLQSPEGAAEETSGQKRACSRAVSSIKRPMFFIDS